MHERIGKQRLLLIDTCSAAGVAGLSEGPAVLAERQLGGRSASAQLAGAVQEMLQQCGWSIADLEGVGVVSGPGSFTGLRTGLAFAKGLCVAREIPMAAISRLAVLGDAAVLHGMAVLDAGRDAFYVRLQAEDGSPREWMCSGGELPRLARGLPVIVAEAHVAEALVAVQPQLHEIKLRDMLPAVSERLLQGGTDVASSDANYLRGEASIYPPLHCKERGDRV